MITRRDVCGALALGSLAIAGQPVRAASWRGRIERGLAALEARHGGRLGVAIVDTGSGRTLSHRGYERFPMCSTVKFPTAALVLARVDRGQERLDRHVSYGRRDLATYSPVTEKNVRTGMAIGALCEAAITLSDNTAQNLLFDSFGGPAALTAYLRSIGDRVTRSDRRETALNDVARGDPRDTSSPLAMLRVMQRTLTGDALSRLSRDRLAAWMLATTTGDKRLSAGAPAGWRTGDKTGTGARNATNDIAIFYPNRRAPILITAFHIDSPASLDAREALLADVGRLAALR